MLLNLFSNARKYSPDGGAIEAQARMAGSMVEISVTDAGLGLPANAVPRVFERFYRVAAHDRRAISGTGLGLAIVQQIVEAHGGQIWAESAGTGQGSTFRFTLPLALFH